MNYPEASWCGPDILGNRNPSPAAFQHIADWQEHRRRMRRDPFYKCWHRQAAEIASERREIAAIKRELEAMA